MSQTLKLNYSHYFCRQHTHTYFSRYKKSMVIVSYMLPQRLND